MSDPDITKHPQRSIALFGKPADSFTDRAIALLRERTSQLDVFLGARTDPLPVEHSHAGWDVIISYRSAWILPAWLLAQARVAAVNFHPAPPEYPGTGCTNFALYEGAREYGVTVHHMAPAVDTGPLIAVKRFPVRAQETLLSLTQHCYEVMFELFVELLNALSGSSALPVSAEHWTRAPFRREQLEALCRIDPTMDAQEVQRRIRATTYPGMPGATITIAGQRFLSESALEQGAWGIQKTVGCTVASPVR